jgi:ribonuclease BN (tRNA processing enzyme)
VKLTILGSGTSRPDGDRNSAGYFVETGDARIMLDCGAGTVHALARYNLPWEKMTHVFISHFHVDHCGELASLLFALKWGLRSERKEPLRLIGPYGLERVIEGLKLAFGAKLFALKFPLEVRMISPGENLELSTESKLSVAKTPHTQESLAVRIESNGNSICYTGDTDASDELPQFFSKTDLLVSECSFRERVEGVRHVSISDVARMAAQSEAKRLVVTHFYFETDEEELEQKLHQGYTGEVIIGKDGMMLEV